jgi:hypothetical protein
MAAIVSPWTNWDIFADDILTYTQRIKEIGVIGGGNKRSALRYRLKYWIMPLIF